LRPILEKNPSDNKSLFVVVAQNQIVVVLIRALYRSLAGQLGLKSIFQGNSKKENELTNHSSSYCQLLLSTF